MSLAGFGESLLKTLERISSICKDKHAYLKNCCAFTIGEFKKDPTLDNHTPEEQSNIIFYPLKIASETRDDAFLVLALDAIQRMVAHGIVDHSLLYKAPDVPLPVRKRTFTLLSSNDNTTPHQTPKNEKEENVPLIQVLLGTVCVNSTSPSEEVQLLVVRSLLTAVSTAKCEVHGSLLLMCIRTTCDVYLQARLLPLQTSAKASLSQMIGTVQLKMENEGVDSAVALRALAASEDMDDAASVGTFDTVDNAEKDCEGISFGSPNERDCFVILRSLCKLSSKAVETTSLDSIEMRSKILSLTLLHHFLCNVGASFSSRRSFHTAIHKYLCVSILQNSMSSVPEVCKLSMNILVKLLVDHRGKIKSKIPAFFFNVLFPVLESANASFVHRTSVLHLLEKLLSDGQAIADLFVNFDCVVGAPNLYPQIINRVAKVVQTHHAVPNWISPAQEQQLKYGGAKALAGHLKALMEWIAQLQQRDAAQTEVDEGGEEAVKLETDFERMIKGKRTFEAVLDVFNNPRQKAKEGVALAMKVGLLSDDTPASIANFLLNTKGLDKVKIGEYLATNSPATKEILRAFLLHFDFTGLELDEAMRLFLGKFKILGEAEVVDRTMELFAEQYCSHNPDRFASAGTAYILSFSVMMLNTDAHSVHVKSKMTLDEFLRNNRGIDDGRDLPKEMMESVYQRITTKEIKLEQDGGGAGGGGSGGHGSPSRSSVASTAADGTNGGPGSESIFTSLEKKKQLNYKSETEQLMQNTLQFMSKEGTFDDMFYNADTVEVVAAMWDAAWTPVLPALSVPMEESDDESMVDTCLQGFDRAMALNCFFNLATERQAFISSLLAFTHLTSFREIQYKNVKSITTLINIASREGNALESSWYEILRCISWLDKLHLIGGGTSRQDSSQQNRPRNSSFAQRMAEHKRVEQHNAEVVAASLDQVVVDRVFSRSGELEGRAVVDLVEALCHVSVDELQEQPTPRTYSLQKLVEVAEINIGRLRYVWSQMWVHLSKHFICVGLDNTQQLVPMFVVDSLRQLAFKFLQRDELGNFNFQRDFLKPFEVIATQTTRPDIMELVIASLGQMVDARAKNIMSGWKIVLNTLTRCAQDDHPSVVRSAGEVLERITMRRFHLIATPELMAEVVNAWSQFGANHVDVAWSRKAVRVLGLLAVFLARGVPAAQHPELQEKEHSATTFDELISRFLSSSAEAEFYVPLDASSEGVDSKLWVSLLAALCSLINVGDAETRRLALESLFATLQEYGGRFSHDEWQLIFGGTVLPVFENILCNLPEEGSAGHHVQMELLQHALSGTICLFVAFHTKLDGDYGSFLDACLSCAKRSDRTVVQLGFRALSELVQSLHDNQLTVPWELLAGHLRLHVSELVSAIEATERPTTVTDASAVGGDSPNMESFEQALYAVQQLAGTLGRLLALDVDSPDVLREMSCQLHCLIFATSAALDGEASGTTMISKRHINELLIALRESYTVYLGAANSSSSSLLQLSDQQEKLFQTGNKLLSRLVRLADGRGLQYAERLEEALVLRDVGVQLLSGFGSLPVPLFDGMMSACYKTICTAICVCDPDLSKTICESILVKLTPSSAST